MTVELINCLMYHFGRECLSIDTSFKGVNILGCRFMQTPPDTDIIVTGGGDNDAFAWVVDNIDDVHRINDTLPQDDVFGTFPTLASSTPFLGSGSVSIRRVAEVEAAILPFVGATRPTRDAIDTWIVGEISARTGTLINAVEPGEVTVGGGALSTPSVTQFIANPWDATGREHDESFSMEFA